MMFNREMYTGNYRNTNIIQVPLYTYSCMYYIEILASIHVHTEHVHSTFFCLGSCMYNFALAQIQFLHCCKFYFKDYM